MNDLKPPRAWHKKLKRMGEVDTILWAGGKLQGIRCGAFNYYSRDEVILLMPTGLPDKNGKEIYEGDIVQWHQFKFPISIKNDHGYRFMVGKDSLCREYGEHGQVIGNIYENPDLLEETK